MDEDYYEEFEDVEYLEIHDYDEFCIHVLHHSSIDADLVLAGFKTDEEKLPLFEESLKVPYDPQDDLKIVPEFELKEIVERFIEHDEEGGCFIAMGNLAECCKVVAQRIIWSTFELAAKAGLCEPVIEKDGTLNYILKEDI